MDSEWEEEEQLVVVELSGIINNDFMAKSRSTCKILDIDSDKPMMQVGQYVFAGEYEDTIGSCVLFEEVPKTGKASSSPDLRYLGHTMKKLTMQRIFLTDKKEAEVNTGGCDSSELREETCQPSQEDQHRQPTEKCGDSSVPEGSSVG